MWMTDEFGSWSCSRMIYSTQLICLKRRGTGHFWLRLCQVGTTSPNQQPTVVKERNSWLDQQHRVGPGYSLKNALMIKWSWYIVIYEPFHVNRQHLDPLLLPQTNEQVFILYVYLKNIEFDFSDIAYIT